MFVLLMIRRTRSPWSGEGRYRTVGILLSTIWLVIQENLRLKVRGGQAHNWVGNIRERIFCTREGDLPVLRKKKKRAIRSFSRTYEEMDLISSHAQNRCSRSTNDLSQLLSARAFAQESPCNNSSYAPNDSLSVSSSFRSRNTSVSSSLFFNQSSSF